MKKDMKLFKKQEKRIVKLLYKKGFLKDFKLEDFYWESFKWFKTYKSKMGYRFPRYVPELHFSTVDYWDECDEHSVVDCVLNELFWDNAEFDEVYNYATSRFKIKTREQFIKYLSDLPNKVNDNKIKRVLNIKEY